MKEEDKSEENYIQELYKTLSYGNEQFDKYVLFIASGALGVSFAFIENLVNLNEATHKATLINSWYCFALVIFISLISHFVSAQSLRWSISNYGKRKWGKSMKKWNNAIRTLNIIMILVLLMGAFLLISFIKINI